MAVLIENNATGRLAGSIDSSQTSVSLQAGEGSRFPSPSGSDWFPITFTKPDGDLEIMHCTSRTNDVLTVTRGMEGTSTKTFAAGDRCALRVTAAAYEDMRSSKGDIKLWSGALVDIPTGWALCDGTNGTIDLTDKFVVAAGATYAVGDTGGADSVTLTKAQMPAHKHGASTGSGGNHSHSGSTNTTGSHGHSGSTNTTGNHWHYVVKSGSSSRTLYNRSRPHISEERTASGYELAGSGGTPDEGRSNTAGNHSHSLSINSNGNHSHSVSTNTTGAHSHSVSVSNTGGGESHENRPPYYALAFIQKL